MFTIRNVHQRDLPGTPQEVADLMASLASDNDRLWPKQWWPAMRFDRPLEVGAVGGHGPVRYTVADYQPGQSVTFQFTAPRGFHGTHGYQIEPIHKTYTRLWHVLAMRVTGPALLTWPLIFRPLHDALIEDSLDVAAAHLQQQEPGPRQWSWYVRRLRGILGRSRRR